MLINQILQVRQNQPRMVEIKTLENVIMTIDKDRYIRPAPPIRYNDNPPMNFGESCIFRFFRRLFNKI